MLVTLLLIVGLAAPALATDCDTKGPVTIKVDYPCPCPNACHDSIVGTKDTGYSVHTSCYAVGCTCSPHVEIWSNYPECSGAYRLRHANE